MSLAAIPPIAAPPRRARVFWTAEEDDQMTHLVMQYGYQWRKIAKEMPGKTDDAIRNRWARKVPFGPSPRRETGSAGDDPGVGGGRARSKRDARRTDRRGWTPDEEGAFAAAIRDDTLHSFPFRLFRGTQAWRNKAYRMGLSEEYKACSKKRVAAKASAAPSCSTAASSASSPVFAAENDDEAETPLGHPQLTGPSPAIWGSAFTSAIP